MNVLVVGASRGSGAAAVAELARAGHVVTAFARSATSTSGTDQVRSLAGDVLDADSLGKAMVGQDAVVVALGISDNPIAVRLLRRSSTPLDVRSQGTARVVEAMRAAGVRRLVVQSTYGIGDTYASLPLSVKLFFSLVIKPQVQDHVRQEQIVRGSGLDWTLVRPVVLTDDATDAPATVDLDDRAKSMKVSRSQLGRVVADTLGRQDWVGRTLTVSG